MQADRQAQASEGQQAAQEGSATEQGSCATLECRTDRRRRHNMPRRQSLEAPRQRALCVGACVCVCLRDLGSVQDAGLPCAGSEAAVAAQEEDHARARAVGRACV